MPLLSECMPFGVDGLYPLKLWSKNKNENLFPSPSSYFIKYLVTATRKLTKRRVKDQVFQKEVSFEARFTIQFLKGNKMTFQSGPFLFSSSEVQWFSQKATESRRKTTGYRVRWPGTKHNQSVTYHLAPAPAFVRKEEEEFDDLSECSKLHNFVAGF